VTSLMTLKTLNKTFFWTKTGFVSTVGGGVVYFMMVCLLITEKLERMW